MDLKKFISLFKDSLSDLIRNPVIALPSILLFIFFILFQKVSVNVNYSLENIGSIAITSWLVFFVLFSLMAISYVFSGMISLSKSIISKNKPLKFSNFLNGANGFFLKNFIISIIILILYNLIQFTSFYLAFFIGKFLSLEALQASIIFFLLFFLGTIFILILLTYSPFLLVLNKFSIESAIKKSTKLTSKQYIPTLSILIIFFALQKSLLYLPQIAYELVSAIITIPLFILVLARFVLNSKYS